jgi:hypothetical protein
MEKIYKIYGASNGTPAKLVKEFHAQNDDAAILILEELQKDIQYLNTYLFLRSPTDYINQEEII